MRTMAVVVTMLCFYSSPLCGDDELEGTWRAVLGKRDGEVSSQVNPITYRLTIKGDKLISTGIDGTDKE